jgi:hypothetical protein
MAEQSFKAIKYVHENIDDMYEMSQDGKIVRDKKTGKELKTNFPEKIELKNREGKKKYGVKTLYWSSWNKPLPGTEKKVTGVKKTIQEAGGLKKATARSSKKLFSKLQVSEIIGARSLREHVGSTLAGQQLWLTKSDFLRFLVVKDKDTILLRYSCGNWRNGRWFFHIPTNTHIPFDPETAYDKRKKRSDASIKWPKFAA